MGATFFFWVRLGTLQFVVVKPIIAMLEFMFTREGEYQTGNFSLQHPYIYLSFVQNCSQVWAMYSLVMFYLVTREDLRSVHPVPKFLCIKLVVFFTFWQGLLLSVLVKVRIIRETAEFTTSNVETGAQDFLICVEMFFFSVAHLYAFPVSDFEEDGHIETTLYAPVSSAQPLRPRALRTKSGVMTSLYRAVDIRDVASDVEDAMRSAQELRKARQNNNSNTSSNTDSSRPQTPGPDAQSVTPVASTHSSISTSSAPVDSSITTQERRQEGQGYEHEQHEQEHDQKHEPQDHRVPRSSQSSPSRGTLIHAEHGNTHTTHTPLLKTSTHANYLSNADNVDYL